jgi:hypothetical protein
MRRALLALALVVTPAFAEQAHLNGMAEAVVASEWADPITLDDYLFEPIGFDSEEVETSFLPD